MNKHTAVVTGAAGFIGSRVAREFAEQGWRVAGIGHGEPEASQPGLAVWRCADVCTTALLALDEPVHTIVHCAGGASVGASIDNAGRDFDRTVKTTSEVLEFIRVHSPATRLVYLSSAAVYGEVATIPINEAAALNPVSPYGHHKLMSEMLCKMYARQYGLSIAIVRPFSIFGAGLRKQLLWDACQKVSAGRNDFFGTGQEVRDWLHVDDLARLVCTAAAHASPDCPTVNAGQGEGVANRTLLSWLCDRLGSAEAPCFNTSPKSGDPSAYVADIGRALSWHWRPSVSWRDGVSDYVEWYKRCNQFE